MSLIIGILGRPIKLERESYKISKSVADVIIKYDSIPLGILPTTKDINKGLDPVEITRLHKVIDLCDGIILQGGTDYYNYDMKAIEYIIKKDIPVLGICLGMQSLACATGGKLGYREKHKGDSNYVHSIEIEEGSLLFDIIQKDSIMVNSRHKEMVINTGLYRSVAKSPDCVVEAIELSTKKFNLGVQWHPEDLINFDLYAQKIFDAFFAACNKNK